MIVIGTLVEKDVGLNAYNTIYDMIGVDYIFLETGRSDDLSESKQFGNFGEAAILTLIVQEHEQDNILRRLAELCGDSLIESGKAYIGQKLTMSAL